MHYKLTASFAIALCAALVAGTAFAQDMQQYQRADGGDLIAYGCNDDSVVVRSIHDEGNPYAGEYGEWDYWAWANAREVGIAEILQWNNGEGPEGHVYLSIEADENGYPIPLTDSLAHIMELKSTNALEAASYCVTSYTAYTEMPQELRGELYSAMAEVRAGFMREVPQWLALDPPQGAIILPDGRVVTRGLLASSSDAGFSGLYSADGELMSQLPASEPWWKLTFENAEAELAQYFGDGVGEFFHAGFVVVRDRKAPETLAIYSYDGELLPVDTDIYSNDANHWETLSASDLPLLYAAQQGSADSEMVASGN